MDIVNLPQDIFPGKELGEDEIIIHEYAARKGAFKGRSVLHRNAISLVLQGEKTMHFAERTVSIKEDEFHILSAGNCLASIDLSKQEVYRSILVFFTDNILTDFFVKYEKIVHRVKTKINISPQSIVSIKKDSFIYGFIASLQLALNSPQPFSGEMKRLKLEELLLYLLEQYPHYILAFQPHVLNSSSDLGLRNAVESNITSNLSIEELAFLCNLSISTFKRRFQKIYGCSPNKWFLKKKMELAANLLLNHRQRPGEVFYQVGYENHSSFTQSFKQVFGQTPREYQERLIAQNS